MVPPAQLTPRLRSIVKGSRVRQQAARTTTHGNVASTHRMNLQQVSRSQAESTCSATIIREKRDEAGPSRPQKKTTSGGTIGPNATIRSQEREVTKDARRPSCNVFDRLSRSRGEEIRRHLEARLTSATSRKREEVPVISLINDEINELRARL